MLSLSGPRLTMGASPLVFWLLLFSFLQQGNTVVSPMSDGVAHLPSTNTLLSQSSYEIPNFSFHDSYTFFPQTLNCLAVLAMSLALIFINLIWANTIRAVQTFSLYLGRTFTELCMSQLRALSVSGCLVYS